MRPRAEAMARLELSGDEYRTIVAETTAHLDEIGGGLAAARESADHEAAAVIARRFREPAEVLGAARLIGALDVLDGSPAATDNDRSLSLVASEVAVLRVALDVPAAAAPAPAPRPEPVPAETPDPEPVPMAAEASGAEASGAEAA